jgi:uncharacterized protein (TIGR00288 family)
LAPWWLQTDIDDDEDDEGPIIFDESELRELADSEDDGAPEQNAREDSNGHRREEPRRRRRRRSAGGGNAPATSRAAEETPAEAPRRDEPATTAARLANVMATSGAGAGDDDIPSIVYAIPARNESYERKIALFCDLENLALGVRDSSIKKLDIVLILERLLEKGKIIVKKAYADWERYAEFKRPFHESAIELINIPQKHYSGKNSADIKMVVDAMDLCYSKEHLDTFVLLSGDSDFSPLVSKLKENNKAVIGVGVKNSSSKLLIDNCDEFIYYEDIWRSARSAPQVKPGSKADEAFNLMVDAIQALQRENKDVLWGSMIKQTMQRKNPSFNEGYYGYSTFSELLEDAQEKKFIDLKTDPRSGTYVVTGFQSAAAKKTRSRRKRSSRSKSSAKKQTQATPAS